MVASYRIDGRARIRRISHKRYGRLNVWQVIDLNAISYDPLGTRESHPHCPRLRPVPPCHLIWWLRSSENRTDLRQSVWALEHMASHRMRQISAQSVITH